MERPRNDKPEDLGAAEVGDADTRGNILSRLASAPELQPLAPERRSGGSS